MESQIIDLWCFNKNHRDLIVLTSSDKIPKDKKDEYFRIRFIAKPLTWKMHNDAISASAYRVKGGSYKTDWMKYREVKLKAVLSEWDITDEDGNVEPVTEENVLGLHPALAEAFLSEYDKQNFMTESRQKTLVLKAFKYYSTSFRGGPVSEAPQQVIELSLMEKFGWTPTQIDEIGYLRLQELFLMMNQREHTEHELKESEQWKEEQRAKSKKASGQ